RRFFWPRPWLLLKLSMENSISRWCFVKRRSRPPGLCLFHNEEINQGANPAGEDDDQDPDDLGVLLLWRKIALDAIHHHPDPKGKDAQEDEAHDEKEDPNGDPGESREHLLRLFRHRENLLESARVNVFLHPIDDHLGGGAGGEEFLHSLAFQGLNVFLGNDAPPEDAH